MWVGISIVFLAIIGEARIFLPLAKQKLGTNSFLNNTSNMGYIANIWVGTPAQEFQVYISAWTSVIF